MNAVKSYTHAAGALLSLLAMAASGCGPSQAQQASPPARVDAPSQAHAATRAATAPASGPAYAAPEAVKVLARSVVTALSHKSSTELAPLLAASVIYEHGVSHGEQGFRGPGAPQRLDLKGFMQVIESEAPPADAELDYEPGGRGDWGICRWKTSGREGWVDELRIFMRWDAIGGLHVTGLSLWTMSMKNK